MPTAIIAVAPPILGMAQAARDLTLARVGAASKPIAYSFYDDLRKAPSMQLALAQASTLIDAAVLLMRRWSDVIADAARPARILLSPSGHKCGWISATL
jgi:hypothetical protein